MRRSRQPPPVARTMRVPVAALIFYSFLLLAGFAGAVWIRAIDFGPDLNGMIQRGFITLTAAVVGGSLCGVGMGWLGTQRLRSGLLTSAILAGALVAAGIGFLSAPAGSGASCAGVAAALGGAMAAVVYAIRTGR